MSTLSSYTLDYTTISPSSLKVQDPPGFTSTTNSTKVATSSKPSPVNLDALRAQKAWEVALAPAKTVPMQAFMMYMTGGGIQVFSVMSVWFLLKQAFAGILSVQKVFLPYTAAKAKTATPIPGVNSSSSDSEPQSFLQQKAVYLLCQLGLLGVGLWKLNSMGLLPTHESDWIHFGTYSEWKREVVDTSHVRHLMGKVRYQ